MEKFLWKWFKIDVYTVFGNKTVFNRIVHLPIIGSTEFIFINKWLGFRKDCEPLTGRLNYQSLYLGFFLISWKVEKQ